MSIQIKIRVPDEWESALKRAVQQAGFPLEAPKGRVGGMAAWVRHLVARELGFEEQDPHALQSARYAAERGQESVPDQ